MDIICPRGLQQTCVSSVVGLLPWRPGDFSPLWRTWLIAQSMFGVFAPNGIFSRNFENFLQKFLKNFAANFVSLISNFLIIFSNPISWFWFYNNISLHWQIIVNSKPFRFANSSGLHSGYWCLIDWVVFGAELLALHPYLMYVSEILNQLWCLWMFDIVSGVLLWIIIRT